jgi:hypothetical protein
MPYLNFINDDTYHQIVKDILTIGFKAKEKSEKQFNRNVIDPFAMVFEMASFDIDSAGWVLNEQTRQAQKSLSNHIGLIHQKILGSIKGWSDLETGNIVDLVNHERKIIAEVKNKHNTTKGSDKVGVYYKLSDLVLSKASQYKDYTAYFVEIIPKTPKRHDAPFTPSDNTRGVRCEASDKIRQIDGASFYTLVTNEHDALENIFKTLPLVIKDCIPSFNLSQSDINNATNFFKLAFDSKQS